MRKNRKLDLNYKLTYNKGENTFYIEYQGLKKKLDDLFTEEFTDLGKLDNLCKQLEKLLPQGENIDKNKNQRTLIRYLKSNTQLSNYIEGQLSTLCNLRKMLIELGVNDDDINSISINDFKQIGEGIYKNSEIYNKYKISIGKQEYIFTKYRNGTLFLHPNEQKYKKGSLYIPSKNIAIEMPDCHRDRHYDSCLVGKTDKKYYSNLEKDVYVYLFNYKTGENKIIEDKDATLPTDTPEERKGAVGRLYGYFCDINGNNKYIRGYADEIVEQKEVYENTINKDQEDINMDTEDEIVIETTEEYKKRKENENKINNNIRQKNRYNQHIVNDDNSYKKQNNINEQPKSYEEILKDTREIVNFANRIYKQKYPEYNNSYQPPIFSPYPYVRNNIQPYNNYQQYEPYNRYNIPQYGMYYREIYPNGKYFKFQSRMPVNNFSMNYKKNIIKNTGQNIINGKIGGFKSNFI